MILWQLFCILFPHVCICDSVSVFRFPMFLFLTGCCSFFFQCLYLWQLFCIGKRWKILPRDPEQGTLARNILIHKLKTFSYLQIILIHKLKTVPYSQIIRITIRKKTNHLNLQTQDILLFTNHWNPQTEDIILFKNHSYPLTIL